MMNQESPPVPSKKSPILIITIVLLIGLAITGGALFWSIHHNGPPSPPGTSGISYTYWTEPAEHAFTVLLPQGWTATGSIDRSYVKADFNFDAKDPTNSMGVFFRLDVAPLYLEDRDPNCPTYGNLVPTCNPGQYWTPTDQGAPSTFRIYIWPYTKSADYIRQFYLPYLQKIYPDTQLISVRANPQLDSQFSGLLYGQSDASEAVFHLTTEGRPYSMGVVIVTTSRTVGTYTVWWADISGAYAPQQDFSTVGRFYSTILPTATVSVPWLKQEIPSEQAKYQLIEATSSQIINNDMRLFNQIVKTQSVANEAWANAFSLTGDFMDPYDGQIHNVPLPQNGNCWWKNGYGNTIVLAKCDEPPPGGDYRPMIPETCDQQWQHCKPT